MTKILCIFQALFKDANLYKLSSNLQPLHEIGTIIMVTLQMMKLRYRRHRKWQGRSLNPRQSHSDANVLHCCAILHFQVTVFNGKKGNSLQSHKGIFAMKLNSVNVHSEGLLALFLSEISGIHLKSCASERRMRCSVNVCIQLTRIDHSLLGESQGDGGMTSVRNREQALNAQLLESIFI